MKNNTNKASLMERKAKAFDWLALNCERVKLERSQLSDFSLWYTVEPLEKKPLEGGLPFRTALEAVDAARYA